jgi:hypothetical protein
MISHNPEVSRKNWLTYPDSEHDRERSMSGLGFLHTLKNVACVGLGFMTEAHTEEDVDGERGISYP